MSALRLHANPKAYVQLIARAKSPLGTLDPALPALDETAAAWREKLEATIRATARGDDLPLLLSGGVDSGTILAALLTLGLRPRCIAFDLRSPLQRDNTFGSTDAAIAAQMARDAGLPFDLIHIPRDPETLVGDVRRLIAHLPNRRKTAIQCAQPVMWMAQRLHETYGATRAFAGTGGIVEDNRAGAVILHDQGEEAMRLYRRARLDDRYRDGGTGAMHRIARVCGVTLEEPYSDEPFKGHALALDCAEINWPVQKGIALRAYPGFWRRGYYRKNSPLQVNSGIREWHDTLLNDPAYNPGGRFRSVTAVYNRMTP